MLHLSLRAANLILELPACVLEGIVDGECQIGMPSIRRRRPFHINLASVRKRETNMDLVKSAFAVMPPRPLQHDSARGYATPPLLEFGHMFLDGILDSRGCGHALKFDFRRRLHFLPSLVRSAMKCLT
jgi:hypothetical protein